MAGITHTYRFSDHLSHVLTVFGTHTDFKNPFVTNYETRIEKNLGLRTYLAYQNQDQEEIQWEMQLGAEGQRAGMPLNYDNNFGSKGELQYNDQLENLQHFYFYRAKAKLMQKLIVEGSIGLNFNNIDFKRNNPAKMPLTGIWALIRPGCLV